MFNNKQLLYAWVVVSMCIFQSAYSSRAFEPVSAAPVTDVEYIAHLKGLLKAAEAKHAPNRTIVVTNKSNAAVSCNFLRRSLTKSRRIVYGSKTFTLNSGDSQSISPQDIGMEVPEIVADNETLTFTRTLHNRPHQGHCDQDCKHTIVAIPPHVLTITIKNDRIIRE